MKNGVVAQRAWKLLPWALIGLAVLLCEIACSTSKGASTSEPASTEEVHAEKPSHGTLELNGGKKWVVNKAMLVHLQNIEKEIQDFERNPGDHAVLASNIQENLGRLVTSCTMEGKAHEELHKWLMPLLGTSAEYAKATDPVVQQAKLQEIKKSLEVFHSYFE